MSTRRRSWLLLLPALVAVASAAAFLPSSGKAQDTGWVIDSAAIEIDVTADGVLKVTETWEVDFGDLERHGIFRDLFTRFPCSGDFETCPDGYDRIYPITVHDVRNNGRPTPFEVSENDDKTSIKIGDADIEVTGEQTYLIRYDVAAALNPQPSHDELYWNVIGSWPVTILAATVELTLPENVPIETLCYQGFFGSTEECLHGSRPGSASFEASRFLVPGDDLTIIAGWEKGVVEVQPFVLEEQFTIEDFFTLDFWEWGLMALVGVLALGAIIPLWWLSGRDRSYKSIHYLTGENEEGRRPLFGPDNIVVEYLPPEDLRPAQMGLILDESADTLDVTATIVDLACRGYLHITEVPKQGWFGKRDWELTKLKEGDDGLAPYEDRLFKALFSGRDAVRVSTLKNTFYKTVQKVKSDLYKDAKQRHWFSGNPSTTRTIWRLIAVAVIVIGALACIASGFLFERALIPVLVIVAGIVLLFVAGAMPRRTAAGSEALRRTLGFRLYVETAETHLQQFNEEQSIFARYLPYAMVFECVDRWAKALEAVGARPEDTAGWYTGTTPLRMTAFAASLQGFSSGVSTSITSTPGSSGGSGFSGGSSGGGGGGGGGGSW